jgi:hypothetical protein
MRFSTPSSWSALGMMALLGTACADAPTAPESFALPSLDVVSPVDPTRGTVVVCKIGGTAEFEVDGASIGELTDECATVASSNAAVLSVTVEEIVPANTTLDSIVRIHGVATSSASFPQTADTTTFYNTTSATAQHGLEHGTVLLFFNTVTPPGGGEGCTPGYWKQDQHFDSWPAPYTPDTQFSDVFEDAFPGMTLLEVASQGGGGLNALGRHTVAALLNAASAGVDYDMTAAEVIAAFNAVFPGGDYAGLKDTFEGFNEQGCPLN